MNIIDLTQLFTDNMPVYPGDMTSSLEKIADIEVNGTTNHKLVTSMHVGTHIDAPLHMIKGGKRISDIDTKQFIGLGVLIDARDKKTIDSDLLTGKTIQKESIVLIYTGWSDKFSDSDYFDKYPVLTEKFAQKLVDCGVKMVGMDTPSPDKYPYVVHKILLQKEILIIENLTNLHLLADKGSFEVIALPLKLSSDASLARVVARIE